MKVFNIYVKMLTVVLVSLLLVLWLHDLSGCLMNVKVWSVLCFADSYTQTPPPAHTNPFSSSVQPIGPPPIWPFVAPMPIHSMHHNASVHRHPMSFAGMPFYPHTHVPVVPLASSGTDLSMGANVGEVNRSEVSSVLFIIQYCVVFR